MRTILISTLLSMALATASPAVAASLDPFLTEPAFVVPSGQTRTGDVYVLAGETSIAGRHEGDLIAWTEAMRVDGQVTGDLIVGTRSLDIAGTVGEAVRVFAENISVSGTIEGDLVVLGARVTIHDRAHVKGNLYACAGIVTQSGAVDGDIRMIGGEILLGGPVGGNVYLEADAVRLNSNANILGDLSYESRKELEQEEGAAIAGETIFKEKVDKVKKKRLFSAWSVGKWLWLTTASMLVGFVLLALLRRVSHVVVSSVGAEPLVGGLVGFGTFLVVPAVSILAMVLVIPLPLGVMALVVFTIALYVAKLPVAIWLGRRLLGMLGSSDPSPYFALAVGVIVLYVLFTIPFLVGWLAWLASAWLGLGAMILAARAHLHPAEQP